MVTKPLAYEKWLGIKQEHQPPSLYRLLAIDEFEADSDVIANAADSRMAFVRQFQSGANARLSAEILNELARARIILLNPQKKAAYDAQLRPAPSARRNTPLTDTPPPPLPTAANPVFVAPWSVAAAATEAAVDIESLVSGTSPAISSQARPKSRAPMNPVVAVLVGGAIVAGCAIAGLTYLLTGNRLDARAKQKDSRSSGLPEVSATPPGKERAKLSADRAPSGSAKDTAASPLCGPDIAPRPPSIPKPPRAERARPYDALRLAKDVEEIQRLSKAVKTANESRGVAEKAIVLADRAVVLGNADTARNVAVLCLAAARSADSLWIARRATVLLIQLQVPLSDAVKQNARNRLGSLVEEVPMETVAEVTPSGPSIGKEVSSLAGAAQGSRDARWGKTEAERRRIFFALLKAVDDYGMTAEGRTAWKDIQTRNGIDTRVVLGILNEGFGSFSDWEQPNGGGRASARTNRMEWVGKRTRTMTEPMLQE